ncbi:hypothetical protein C1645_840279 [Glomus cerebriforme]|uniref:F-box domain-containing protein n=1 Tax=Glomus cerebriforme TaxID=658196 RepID=A0A397S4G8_9GLOM|nr:hypothetical protein C1645_840279 [Glomus cerebriforme]
MSQLNKDILFLIFEELQNDSKFLFSCLLVNRLWCETVVPILWRNPWSYELDYSNKSYLFTIIAFYLPVDIKEFLSKHEINFPSTSYRSLLFDYLSFCRSFNVNIINSIISIGSFLEYNQFILQQEFYKILITKCSELKYLDMRSINHQIFYFPEAKVRLGTLYEINSNTTVDPTYFYGLARICKNIQKLVIINDTIKVNHGIAKLIEAQENLKNFEWKDEFDDDDFVEDPYKEILLILEKKADSLNHLKISFQYIYGFEHTFLQKVIPNFYNLKTLIIEDFDFFTKNQLIYKSMEVLYIDYITIKTAFNIIENSGGHLKEILLFKFYDYYFEENFNEDSLNFIRKVREHCPSIEYLTPTFAPTKEHFTEFENLLKKCKLERMIIEGSFRKNSYAKLLFNILLRSAPNTLREIRFFNDFKFSLQVLEEFFKQWRGRPALSILTTDNLYREDDYVRMINKYKNEEVIKDFKVVPEYKIYY